VLGAREHAVAEGLVSLAWELAQLFERQGAELVVTHAFEGGHPDHDAVAFAVHAAARLLEAARLAPAIWEMTGYHAKSGSWRFGEFLPSPGSPEVVMTLTPERRAQKSAMLRAHATQRTLLARVSCLEERFRAAPSYDFGCRPSDGPVLYERRGWPQSFATFVERIRSAERSLGLRVDPPFAAAAP
jgi:N-acetylglucosamine malate deacetylase 2